MGRKFCLSTRRKNAERKKKVPVDMDSNGDVVVDSEVDGGCCVDSGEVDADGMDSVGGVDGNVDTVGTCESLPIHCLRFSPASSLSALQESLHILPQGWKDVTADVCCGDRIVLARLVMEGDCPVVASSITISEQFSWKLHVHGKNVPLQGLNAVPPALSSVSAVTSAISFVGSSSICCGNYDEKFIPLVQARKGKFMDVSGAAVIAYYDLSNPTATIRTTACSYLLTEPGRCSSCRKYRDILRSMLYRSMQPSDHDKSDRSSCTNLRYLSTPQKIARFRRLRLGYKCSEVQLKRLRSKLTEYVEERGIAVDEGLHEDLCTMVEESSSQFAAGSFQQVFWEQQQQAAKVKSSRAMRWDPLMIRWSLYLRHLSGRAYELLRDSGVVVLPSQRTLRDYTYYTKAAPGFSDDVDQQLMAIAKVCTCPDRDKYVCILMDEMHIKSDLVYDKHTGALTGFTNIGDVNSHLAAFEEAVEGGGKPEVRLAKSMLVLMVRGLFSTLQFPYAQFPCCELSGDQMYAPFWEAVGRLEKCGFCVMALVCDGLAANRRLFKLHDQSHPGEVYKVPNPYSEGRHIFFLSDPPHLIKTVRNAWSNSKRQLWCKGKEISWSHLVRLYESRSDTGLALVPKLKFEHLHLTSFSKMRVDLAAQVLSNQVSIALENFGGEDAKETAMFAAKFNKFFDCLNVSNFSAGKRQRDPFKSPYRSAEDFRLKWLKEEFLGYLVEWQQSVQARDGFSRMQKNKMLLSPETLSGIRITVNSFVELVQFLFTLPDVAAFLSNKLCQDPLEKFFGQQRQRGRVNENPNARDFYKNTQALRVVHGLCRKIRGNCRGSNTSGVDPMLSEPIPKRRRIKN